MHCKQDGCWCVSTLESGLYLSPLVVIGYGTVVLELHTNENPADNSFKTAFIFEGLRQGLLDTFLHPKERLFVVFYF